MNNIQLLDFRNFYNLLSVKANKHLEEYVRLAYWDSRDNWHEKVVLPVLELVGVDEYNALFKGTVSCRGSHDDYEVDMPLEFAFSQQYREDLRVKTNEEKDRAWEKNKHKETSARHAQESKERKEYERLKLQFEKQ